MKIFWYNVVNGIDMKGDFNANRFKRRGGRSSGELDWF